MPRSLLQSLRERLFLVRLWRANGFGAVRHHLKERHRNHCQILSHSPAVVLLVWGRDDLILHKRLRDVPLTICYLLFWNFAVQDLGPIIEHVRARHSQFPRHRLVFLCNEEFQRAALQAAGVSALFCNHNAFCNENILHPDPAVPKKFDAVYNASMSPYKRHALAANIPTLALITYRNPAMLDPAYEQTVRAALPHAFWANDARDGATLNRSEVVHILNQSRVGLCLSAIEGAMFSSMEYLLCGLPVVSTPSQGGRDVFWDDRFVIVCAPDPASVARAVEELKQRRLDPAFVRSVTLERVAAHRQRLRDFLRPEVPSIEIPWTPDGFPHRYLPEVARELLSAHTQVPR